MKRIGHRMLARDRGDGTALGGAVELGDDEAGEAERLVEGLHLAHRVLPGVGVDHEPASRAARSGIGLGHHALHLADLVHEVQLRGQAPGGVGEHDVDALARAPTGWRRRSPRPSRPFLRDHGHVVARAPFGELLARRGAEGVAGGEQHRLALRTGRGA